MKATILALALVLSSFARADGFGTDLIFGNLIASPDFIARTACPDFRISAGESLQVFAQEDSFVVEGSDGSFPVSIQVPSQGSYIFKGQSPDRTANEIVSKALDVRASMNPRTTDVTFERLSSTEQQPCALTRCQAFGVCQ